MAEKPRKTVCGDENGTPVYAGDLVKVVAKNSIRGFRHGAVMRAYDKCTLRSKAGRLFKAPFFRIETDHKPDPSWQWSYRSEPVYRFDMGKKIPGIVKLTPEEENKPKKRRIDTRTCHYCGNEDRPKFYTMLDDGEWGFACQDAEACDLDDPDEEDDSDEISDEAKKLIDDIKKENQHRQKQSRKILYDETRERWMRYRNLADNAKAAKRMAEAAEESKERMNEFNRLLYREAEEKDEWREIGYTTTRTTPTTYAICKQTAFCTRAAGHKGRCYHVNADGEKSYL